MKTMKISLLGAFLLTAIISFGNDTKSIESKAFTLERFIQKELKLPVGFELEEDSTTVWVSYTVNEKQFCEVKEVITADARLKVLVLDHFKKTNIISEKSKNSAGMVKITFLREV